MSRLFQLNTDTTPDDFVEDCFIEEGAYGKVYRVTDVHTKRVFAIKKIDKLKIKRQNMAQQLKNEIEIMSKIRHPNIVQMKDCFETDSHLCLVLEFVDGGSLITMLRERRYLDEYTTRGIMRSVVAAVKHLHSLKIIHRDIKPQNILMDRKNGVKLADFGWSNYSNILRVTYCGTESYLAPEMITKNGHDHRLDYWCLGVLAYELLAGFSPFDPVSSEKLTANQKRQRLHQNIENVNFKFPKQMSLAAQSFIKGLLQKRPEDRMNIQQMESHQFLKDSIEKRLFIKPHKANEQASVSTANTINVNHHNKPFHKQQHNGTAQKDDEGHKVLLKTISAKLSQFQKQNRELQLQLSCSKVELASLHEEYKSIKTQCEILKQMCLEYQIESKHLKAIQQKHESALKQAHTLKVQNTRLCDKIRLLETEIQDLNEQLEIQTQQKKTTQEAHSKLEKVNEQLQRDIQELRLQKQDRADSSTLIQSLGRDQEFKQKLLVELVDLKYNYTLGKHKLSELLEREDKTYALKREVRELKSMVLEQEMNAVQDLEKVQEEMARMKEMYAVEKKRLEILLTGAQDHSTNSSVTLHTSPN